MPSSEPTEEPTNNESQEIPGEPEPPLESEKPEEIADIEEVILAIIKLKGITKEKIEEIRKEKSFKRGAFDKKLFLIRED